MSDIPSLDGYLVAPRGYSADTPELTGDVLAAIIKMMPHTADIVFTKWAHLKKISSLLVASGAVGSLKLKLTPRLKAMAYMREGDAIYLSLGLILGRSALAVLSVYIHELAHVILSEREDYAELKALQREFTARFSDEALVERASPIEVYASILTVALLRAILPHAERESCKNRLEAMILEREEKLMMLEGELLRLKELN